MPADRWTGGREDGRTPCETNNNRLSHRVSNQRVAAITHTHSLLFMRGLCTDFYLFSTLLNSQTREPQSPFDLPPKTFNATIKFMWNSQNVFTRRRKKGGSLLVETAWHEKITSMWLCCRKSWRAAGSLQNHKINAQNEFQIFLVLKTPRIAVKKHHVGSSGVLHFRDFKEIVLLLPKPSWKIWFLHSHSLEASWQTGIFFFRIRISEVCREEGFYENPLLKRAAKLF